MDYAEELALKRRRVQDNLARIGGSEVEVEEILGAAETRRYRNKAQYPVSPDGRIGFYRARTHEVIDTRECLLVKPEADAAAEAVRQYMRDFHAAGYDERTGRGPFAPCLCPLEHKGRVSDLPAGERQATAA